jgi:predicted DNA-binding WGR domain protein
MPVESRATGRDLALAVTLMFEDSNSDKEYHIVLYRSNVSIQYGRRDRAGNGGNESFESLEKAAAFFWKTIRSKTGKGYRVAEALTLDLADESSFAALLNADGSFVAGDRTGMWDVMQQWIRVAKARIRNGIAADQPQPHWTQTAPTPRTAREGLHVILALTSPDCDADTLAHCAFADATERFLWPLAISHPNCSDETKAGRALIELGQ